MLYKCFTAVVLSTFESFILKSGTTVTWHYFLHHSTQSVNPPAEEVVEGEKQLHEFLHHA